MAKTIEEFDSSSKTKEDWVYDQIKEDILRNNFQPGAVMVERKIAEKYNVSRSPIRHALKQLMGEGLLTKVPGTGIVVPVYTLEDVLQIYDLLEVLQIYAIQVSLKNYNQIADTKLKYIVDEIDNDYKHKDLVARMEWDIEFHSFIINNVGNKRLDAMFEMLVNQKRRLDITSYDDLEHGKITTEQHKKIYEAILKRDEKATIEAIQEHTRYIKKYYIDKLIVGKYRL